MLLDRERTRLLELRADLDEAARALDRLAGEAMRQPLPCMTSIARLYDALDHVRQGADMLAPLTEVWAPSPRRPCHAPTGRRGADEQE